MALIGLRKQSIIAYFSCSLLTSLFMLRPMILLTVDAAIFHEFASGAHLELDVVDFRFATVGTHFVGL